MKNARRICVSLLSLGMLGCQSTPPPGEVREPTAASAVGRENTLWAVTPDESARAACLAGPLDRERMIAWVDAQVAAYGWKDVRVDREVHGIRFKDENPLWLFFFEVLTTREPQYLRSVVTLPQKTFTSSCERVVCALDEIFGPAAGVPSLYLLARFGINTSHLAQHDVRLKAFKPDELGRMAQAYGSLPPHLYPPKPRPFGIRRMSGNGPGVMANPDAIYDNWNGKPAWVQQNIVLHEFAHTLAEGFDLSPTWINAASWRFDASAGYPADDERGYRLVRPETAISLYGAKNPFEDMAESFLAYRFVPARLLAFAPQKYEFLKRYVFDGMELRGEADCRRPPVLNSRADAANRGDPMELGFGQGSLAVSGAACSTEASQVLADIGATPAWLRFRLARLQACHARALLRAQLFARSGQADFFEKIPLYNRSTKNWMWSGQLSAPFAGGFVRAMAESIQAVGSELRMDAYSKKRCEPSAFAYGKFDRVGGWLLGGKDHRDRTIVETQRSAISAWLPKICGHFFDGSGAYQERSLSDTEAFVKSLLL